MNSDKMSLPNIALSFMGCFVIGSCTAMVILGTDIWWYAGILYFASFALLGMPQLAWPWLTARGYDRYFNWSQGLSLASILVGYVVWCVMMGMPLSRLFLLFVFCGVEAICAGASAPYIIFEPELFRAYEKRPVGGAGNDADGDL